VTWIDEVLTLALQYMPEPVASATENLDAITAESAGAEPGKDVIRPH
ncbi:MAG: hypothetical protein H0T87_01795, partial [Gammaproteobacteria bacterium]|nr:hypothetical protein [Gammaproteobacteria bacterium]